MKSTLSKSASREIAEAYARGDRTLQEIADEFGISAGHVYFTARKEGMEKRGGQGSSSWKLTDCDIEEILRLHATGLHTLQSIGERFGVTRERVRQLAEEAGLKRRSEWIAERIVKRESEKRVERELRAARNRDKRFTPTDRAMAVSRLYKAGYDLQKIADLTGFKNVASLGVRMSGMWRKRWPHLFPRRRPWKGDPPGFVGEPDLRPYDQIKYPRRGKK